MSIFKAFVYCCLLLSIGIFSSCQPQPTTYNLEIPDLLSTDRTHHNYYGLDVEGSLIALSVANKSVLEGQLNSFIVIYQYAGGTWNQIQVIEGVGNRKFGSLDLEGDLLFVQTQEFGSPREIWIFEFRSNQFTHVDINRNNAPYYGQHLLANDQFLICGSGFGALVLKQDDPSSWTVIDTLSNSKARGSWSINSTIVAAIESSATSSAEAVQILDTENDLDLIDEILLNSNKRNRILSLSDEVLCVVQSSFSNSPTPEADKIIIQDGSHPMTQSINEIVVDEDYFVVNMKNSDNMVAIILEAIDGDADERLELYELNESSPIRSIPKHSWDLFSLNNSWLAYIGGNGIMIEPL